jgi:L-aminopeptidase/D-esterase-like protein
VRTGVTAVFPRGVGGVAYTVGVLVQCNYGLRRQLTIAGVPVGTEISDLRLCLFTAEVPTQVWLRGEPRCDGGDAARPAGSREDRGSIIIVVATDAPLLPHQLDRVVKRAALGVGKMGGGSAVTRRATSSSRSRLRTARRSRRQP